MKGIEGWEATLEYYSGVSVKEMLPVVENLLTMLRKPPKEMIQLFIISGFAIKFFQIKIRILLA